MLQPWDKGLMGTTLRYPYEIRDAKEYFDDIPNVKVEPDMLKLAEHILQSKATDFDPSQFVDHYEEAVVEMLKKKQAGLPVSRERAGAAAAECREPHGRAPQQYCTGKSRIRSAEEGPQAQSGTGRDAASHCRQEGQGAAAKPSRTIKRSSKKDRLCPLTGRPVQSVTQKGQASPLMLMLSMPRSKCGPKLHHRSLATTIKTTE